MSVRQAVAGVLIVVMIAAGGWFALKSYRQARASDAILHKLAEYSTAEALASYKLSELAHTLSLGLYPNRAKEEIDSLRVRYRALKKQAKRHTFVAIALLLGAVAAAAAVSLRAAIWAGVLSAGVMLLAGSLAPLMSVTLHKTIPYLGDMVLSHQSKTLWGSIATLWDKGDKVVGATVFLFSVAVPWSKLAVLFIAALAAREHMSHKALGWFKRIGKWSMLDVFVVALLLVFLTFRDQDVSRAQIHEGIYFFLGYVLLSMILSWAAYRYASALSRR